MACSSYLLNGHNLCKETEDKFPPEASATHVPLNSEVLSGPRSRSGGYLWPLQGVPSGFKSEKTRILNTMQ